MHRHDIVKRNYTTGVFEAKNRVNRGKFATKQRKSFKIHNLQQLLHNLCNDCETFNVIHSMTGEANIWNIKTQK